jgi:hypothetical protein
VVKKFEFLLTTTSFYVTTACAVALSVALESYLFINFKIASFDYPITLADNQTVDYKYYNYTLTSFHKTEASKLIYPAVGLIRDIAPGIALIVINILILSEIKIVTQRRIYLTNDGSPTTSQSVRVSVQAERRKILMIISTGINYFAGHTLTSANNLGLAIDSKLDKLDQWLCFSFVVDVLFKLSYANSFFFYCFFNLHFRKFAYSTFKMFLYPLFFLGEKVNRGAQQW